MPLALISCLLFAEPLFANDEPTYIDRVGERVVDFENKALNYRLELSTKAYTFVEMPQDMQKIFSANDTSADVSGYGAVYLNRITGYDITNNEDGYEASTEKTVHLPVPGLKPGALVEVVVSKIASVDTGSFPLEMLYMASDRPIAYNAKVSAASYGESKN